MNESLVVRFETGFRAGRNGRKHLAGSAPEAQPASLGRMPRVARLMALAIRVDDLVRGGQLESYAQVAELGHVTRARVSQIMNLLQLAADVQEELLFLPPVRRGRDPIRLAQLQPIARLPQWRRQRAAWKQLLADAAL